MSKKVIYTLVSHPIRAKILLLLAQGEGLSFSELKAKLNISTGSLYHHLYVLSDFLERDEKRRYKLNKEGRKLLSYIEATDENRKEVGFFSYFSLVPLFYLVSERHLRFLPLALLILIISPIILYLSHLEFRIFFLIENQNMNLFQSFINFTFSYILLLLSIWMIFFVFKIKINILINLINISFSFFPLLIFATIYFLYKLYDINMPYEFNIWFLRTIYLIFQFWSIILLTNSIKITNNISAEKSFTIVLLIIYIALFYTILSFI